MESKKTELFWNKIPNRKNLYIGTLKEDQCRCLVGKPGKQWEWYVFFKDDEKEKKQGLAFSKKLAIIEVEKTLQEALNGTE